MLGPPIDATYVHLGLGVCAAAFLVAALGVPTAPPPDATAVADTVDRVAAASYPTGATHPVAATAVRIGPRTVTLRSDGGTASEQFAQRVTPVSQKTELARVLRGARPSVVFESPAEFAAALRHARQASPAWRPAEAVRARAVSWEGVDATLVG
jgi:hypothetical protein